MLKQEKKFMSMPGSRISAGLAQAAGEVLEKIKEEDGAIKPERVVEESRKKTAPLHNYFTWDNDVAGEAYRLSQAQNLIRSIRVVVADMPVQEQRAVRYYLSVEASANETRFEGKGYVSLPDIKKDADYRQQVQNAAKANARSWQRKYEDIKDELDFKPVFKAIDKLLSA